MKLIVLFGKPGAGKGTRVSRFLKGREDKWVTLSTGDMIRQAIKSGTKLGKEFQSYTEKGQLVPDELVVQIVENAVTSLKDKNVILDGFPRNTSQAASMFKMELIPDKIICLDASNEEIIQRLSERIVCEDCGETFSLGPFNPPKQEGICDKCGGNLIRRADDEPEVVKNRLEVYEKETAAVLDFMEQNGRDVRKISAELPSDRKQLLFDFMLEN